ncbi:DUF4179 domain-containing protein [Sporosarcina sp. GW1-11]|uniref:DUF4179 domain-containing protein n=1 Tax=Sporosarcina sp. GW1-11 TaxID=2899126 RepID=UPI00294E4D1D|nr:DUF4179 domain-containing protein [Sporosarcina sp. GW1-11]MDV6379128.1 DUF4179 domain-containing protein [Sporosarcina sp. GW1-11]
MTEIERKLVQEKKRLEEVKAPKELNERLQRALEKTPKRRKSYMPQWIAIAAALLLLSFVSYQYNAFAYYGKKMLGFDEIMPYTLAKLHEEGNGQTLDQKYVFPNGTELHLDGILTDENQGILYYTLSNPEGVEDDLSFMELKGLFTHSSARSGTTTMNEQKTVLKGIRTFDPVSTFAKKLTLGFQHLDGWEEITFPYNPRAAMQTVLKQSIKKEVPVDTGTIRFNSIIATPSQTTIKGKFNVANYDRIPLGFSGVKLLADGVEIDQVSGGTSSALNGTTFTIDYDALPKDVTSLKLVVDTFVGYKQIDQTITLDQEQTIAYMDGEELIVNHAKITKDGIQLTIATAENILLDGVSVQVDGQVIPLQTTLRQDYITIRGKEYKERVILFDGRKLPEALVINGLHYEKNYDEVINIPIRK